MRCHTSSVTVLALIATICLAAEAHAQTLGTFRWQQQPYCNIVTVTVTQIGGIYRLEGTDDQCGAAQAASLVGTAFPNPDGSIGMGLNIVATPGGAPVHVDTSISIATLSGTWRDSAGNSGIFVFTPGAGTGGAPRPIGGSIGAVSVNPAQVQLRISGGCSSGQFIQSIEETGSVICASGSGAGGLTGVFAGAGLIGGGSSGSVSLSLPLTGTGAFQFNNTAGFVASGQFLSGPGVPVSGPGTRVMWYPAKAAFRAGNVVGTQWNEASIGNQSVAFGSNTTASGFHSTATGDSTTASGAQSVALGRFTTATGAHALAMGDQTWARGGNSVVFGALSEANAFESVAMGLQAHANGNGSVVLGSYGNALTTAPGTFIFGDRSTTTAITGFDPNQFLVRAAGGTGIYTNAALTTGVTLAPGGGAWLTVSDATLKENFRDLAGEDVLAKLAGMPIREWNYTAQATSIRHVGPTAQDFHAAFGLGENPLRINTTDADGIALVGVQALEARTRKLKAENDALRAELAELKERLMSLVTAPR